MMIPTLEYMTRFTKFLTPPSRLAPFGNPDEALTDERFRRSGDPRIDHENNARRIG